MSPKRRTTRNDLFLVRFWLEEDLSSESEEQSRCAGRVQRAVSGESHEFNDWDTLVEALRVMLAANSSSSTVDGLPETEVNSTSETDKGGEQQ